MKKNLTLITLFTVIMFGLQNCKSSGKAALIQTLEETLCNGILEHFNPINKDVETCSFFSFIGNTNDKVEFKENGEVYLQLFKNNQVFDITQLQQQQRLYGLKNFMQKVK